jgi:hypothetical protein
MTPDANRVTELQEEIAAWCVSDLAGASDLVAWKRDREERKPAKRGKKPLTSSPLGGDDRPEAA